MKSKAAVRSMIKMYKDNEKKIEESGAESFCVGGHECINTNNFKLGVGRTILPQDKTSTIKLFSKRFNIPLSYDSLYLRYVTDDIGGTFKMVDIFINMRILILQIGGGPLYQGIKASFTYGKNSLSKYKIGCITTENFLASSNGVHKKKIDYIIEEYKTETKTDLFLVDKILFSNNNQRILVNKSLELLKKINYLVVNHPAIHDHRFIFQLYEEAMHPKSAIYINLGNVASTNKYQIYNLIIFYSKLFEKVKIYVMEDKSEYSIILVGIKKNKSQYLAEDLEKYLAETFYAEHEILYKGFEKNMSNYISFEEYTDVFSLTSGLPDAI